MSNKLDTKRPRGGMRRGMARFFTEAELGALYSLGEGPRHLYALAQTLGLPQSTMHKALFRLRDAELTVMLEARRSDENPGIFVTPWTLTPAGRKVLDLLVELGTFTEEKT